MKFKNSFSQKSHFIAFLSHGENLSNFGNWFNKLLKLFHEFCITEVRIVKSFSSKVIALKYLTVKNVIHKIKTTTKTIVAKTIDKCFLVFSIFEFIN
jgi:hypothetical protein